MTWKTLGACLVLLACTAGCLQVIDLRDPIPLSDAAQEDVVDDGDAPAEPDLAPDPDVPDDGPEAMDVPEGEDLPVETEDVSDPPIEDVLPDPDADDGSELPPGLEWVEIPDGNFAMGCSPGDDDCASYEEPVHTVSITAFSMTRTEITQAQYESVMGMNPSSHAGCPNCPVESVTWAEARDFCEAIGGRLPTEAEWEYAARGRETTPYYCGDDPACLAAIAWYGEASGNPHPVGEKTDNAFGLYDALGNVWEWVEECWHSTYEGAPGTGDVWSGGDCTQRAYRGGCYESDAWAVRVSNRGHDVPATRSMAIGLRCAK